MTIFLSLKISPTDFFSYLMKQHLILSVLFMLLLLLIGFSFGLVLVGFQNKDKEKSFLKNSQPMGSDNIVSNLPVLEAESVAQTILNELEVGILAYNGRGELLMFNPAVLAILSIPSIPSTFQEFLRNYGSSNGMKATLALESQDLTGLCQVGEKIIKLQLTQASIEEYHKQSWIIILQDITDQDREEKQRKEFVANVSHELKTPLTTISAFSETLIDWGIDSKSKADLKKDILKIYEDAKRMDSLVQNLLLLSSIDSKGIRPKMIQYDIVKIMKQVVGSLDIQAEDKGIDLQAHVLSIVPPVYGDSSALERILINLVSNAIKYTPNEGAIRVSIQLTDNYITIRVKDNGMGLAKENITRVFDRFYRVDNTGSRQYGGTGLGLSIAKELTELQGGTIRLESVLHKGSEFVVTIPKAEKVFKDTITALFEGIPRTEILYENARLYLTRMAEELDFPVNELEKMDSQELNSLLDYLLAPVDSGVEDYTQITIDQLAAMQIDS